MRKLRCPYTFAARSRKAMIDYLLNDRRPYYANPSNYLFNWNVKAYDVNGLTPKGEYALNPAHDAAWRRHLDDSRNAQMVEEIAFEDARRYINEDDWTSYPGDEHGYWEFTFEGRQGGHLCLEKWRGLRFDTADIDGLRETFEEMPFDELRAFYRGIVCADSDFTPAKASENVETQVNWQRHQFEEERNEKHATEIAEFVESVESSRPDMYPAQ